MGLCYPGTDGNCELELEKLKSSFMSHKQLSYKVVYSVYDDANHLFEHFEATFSFDGSSYYSRSGDNESICFGNYFVNIDRSQRRVIVDYARLHPAYLQGLGKTDSLLQKANYAISCAKAGSNEIITLEQKIEDGSLFEIEYDPKDYKVVKYRMYNKQEDSRDKSTYPFIEFAFSGYQYASTSADKFSINKYVDIKGTDVKLMPSLAGFQLVNMLKLNQPKR
jgi:hypothetical protein